MLDGRRVAVVVPASRRSSSSPRRCAGSRSSSTGLPRRRRVSRRDRRAGARRRRPARRGDRPRAERRRRRRDRHGLPAGDRGGIDVTVVIAARRRDELSRSSRHSWSRSHAARSTTRRRTGLVSGEASRLIPRSRYLGNTVLSLLTPRSPRATGTSPTRRRAHRDVARDAALARPRRGSSRATAPRTMLVHLNVSNARVRDIPRGRSTASASAPGYDPQGRAADLVASRQGLLLAAAGEVRDPRLPPACLLLRARNPDDRVSGLLLGAIKVVLVSWATRSRRRRSSSSHTPDLGQPVHALRDVVRHGVEQGAPLMNVLPMDAAGYPTTCV